MSRGGADSAGKEATRIRRPLLFSAAAHLFAIFVLLLSGTHPGDLPFRDVMEVFPVGGTDGERGRDEGAFRGTPAAVSRPPAVLSVPTEEPLVVPSPLPRPRGTVSEEAPLFPERDASREAPAPDASSGPPRESTRREGAGPVASLPASDGPSSGDVPAAAVAAASPFPDTATDLRNAEAAGGYGRGVPGKGDADRASLRERIESRIVYPEEAVRRGQEGDVLLRIRIGRGGVPSEIRIARSSGIRLLDAAARRGVVRAAPLPESPGWVEVPVRFRLR
jgi:protein TonB